MSGNNKIIQLVEQAQLKTNIPAFSPGDTVVVQVRIKEGDKERLQAFEGVVIAIKNRGLGSSFTVRKISHGVGVERTFQTHSHQVDSVTLKRRGDVRQAKLPDPALIGNAGSFFKNPVVTSEQCRDIIGRDPEIVHYPMPDGSVKLAAGWMIDACGWKGKTVGQAGVYEKQALVLVNRGEAIGSEVMTLARAIQESVYGRFGIRLETEPVVV